MSTQFAKSRLVYALLLGCIAGIVAALPFFSLYQCGSQSACLSCEAEDATGCEGKGIDGWQFDVVATIDVCDVTVPSLSGYHVVDFPAAMESAVASPHLQRGPPLG